MTTKKPFISDAAPDNARVHPNKRLGQHFLRDQNILKKIAAACGAHPRETIVEIGPGTGALTHHLASYPNTVIGIEKDVALCDLLTRTFARAPNVRIVHADALRWDADTEMNHAAYIVTGNIPYYITGKLLEIVLERWPQPRRIVFMVQKEVAERICAQPPRLSILGVMTQTLAVPRILFPVSRALFYPQPKVDSAVIELIPCKRMAPHMHASFKKLVAAGFSHPRKYLLSNICDTVAVSKEECAVVFNNIGIARTARAQEIPIALWMKLFALLKTKLS